jgi:hypothetical protein
MVRTASRTPERRRTSSPTAARLRGAKGRSSPSGAWRRVRSRASASCPAAGKRPCPGSGPRGPLLGPAVPRPAKRLQMPNAPVGLNPTCAAIAS